MLFTSYPKNVCYKSSSTAGSRKGKFYSAADLQMAVKFIRDGKLTVNAASKKYQISTSTIYSRSYKCYSFLGFRHRNEHEMK